MVLDLGIFEETLVRIETILLNSSSGKHEYSRNVTPLLCLKQWKKSLPPTKLQG